MVSENKTCCISAYLDADGKIWGLSRIIQIEYVDDFHGTFQDFEISSSIRVESLNLYKEIEKIKKEFVKRKFKNKIIVAFGPKNNDVDKCYKQFMDPELEKRSNNKPLDKMVSIIKKGKDWIWRSGEYNKDLQNLLENSEIDNIEYCSKIQGVFQLIQKPRVLRL